MSGGTLFALAKGFSLSTSIPFIMALIFISYTATGGILTPRKVFTTLFLVSFLSKVGILFVVNALFLVSEGRVAVQRIQVSLLAMAKIIRTCIL